MRVSLEYENGKTLGVNAPTQIVKNALTLILLGGLVIFWGCFKKEENKPASSKNEPASSTESKPQSGGVSNAPGAAPAGPAAVALATADGEKAGTRVEITELKRSSDNTLTLKFALVNDGTESVSSNYNYGDPQNSIKDFNSIGGVTLVDGANKKKYFVVRDTETNCLCSRDIKDIAPKSRANLWAKFPAPPDDVQKISIVIPHFGPIDDVPISR